MINLVNTDVTLTETKPFQYRNRSNTFLFTQEPRENYAMVFMEFGSISYNINNETIHLEQGDVFLLKKGETYDAYSFGDNVPYAFYIAYFDIAEHELPHFKRLTKTTRYKRFLELFEKGYSISEKRSTAYTIALKSVLYDIFCNLYKEYYSSKITEPSFAHMEKAKKYIDINYKKKLSIDSLAETAGFSRAHFKRLFSKYYGVSPSRYITSVRIEHAKSMLESDIFSLNEIAVECGFSDEYYFSKVFQKIVGCPPKKY